MNLLITGRPGVGKTTACRMIMDNIDLDVRGFVTEEIRHGGDRVGFMVEFDHGSSRVLSHVDLDEDNAPSVGKYTVDLETMEWVNNTIKTWDEDTADLFIVDEIGKMELKSDTFKTTVKDLFESEVDLLATIPENGSEFVENLIDRRDTETVKMSENDRGETLKGIVKKLEIDGVKE